MPSSCGQKKCPAGYSGSQCRQIDVDKEPPKVEHCPGDLWVIARNGSAIVTWDEPHFSDNVGVTKIIERNGHRSGQTLLWGTYDITYIASDAAGNSATCSFKVALLAEFCPPLADPLGGSQVCKDWGAGGQFKVCEIACQTGLRFSELVPEFYTCGAEGFWRPTADPMQPLVYPSCSRKHKCYTSVKQKYINTVFACETCSFETRTTCVPHQDAVPIGRAVQRSRPGCAAATCQECRQLIESRLELLFVRNGGIARMQGCCDRHQLRSLSRRKRRQWRQWQ